MRIVFNARILKTPRTGIGHYLTELVNALTQYEQVNPVFFDGRRIGAIVPSAKPSSHANRLTKLKSWLPFTYELRRQKEQYFFEKCMQRCPVDLYHDPSLWPLDFDGPTVMTVHDLTHLKYPETQPSDRLKDINRRFPVSLEKASHILVDSHFIADELVRYYPASASRITVAPLGVAQRFQPQTNEQLRATLQPLGIQPSRYLLCVGTLEPRKNLTLALRAHALLPHALRTRFPLLIVGMPGWKMHDFAREFSRAIHDGHVRMLGYLSDEQVAALTAGARVMMFPSRYEGFGLPVLESMASGTPILLAHQSAMPEVAGDAGIYVEQDDVNAWSEMLHRLIEDDCMHENFRQLGLNRAKDFSWQRCARLTANVYKQVLNS